MHKIFWIMLHFTGSYRKSLQTGLCNVRADLSFVQIPKIELLLLNVKFCHTNTHTNPIVIGTHLLDLCLTTAGPFGLLKNDGLHWEPQVCNRTLSCIWKWRLWCELALKFHPLLWILVQASRLNQASNKAHSSAVIFLCFSQCEVPEQN